MVAFHRRRVSSAEQAFDLAAETFAAVVTSAGAFRGDGSAVGWLYGVARNKLRESLRRGRIEDAARARLALEPVALEDSALDCVERRADVGDSQLQQAVAQLPAGTRDALLARVVDEDDYDAIAARLGCSAQVVRKRVQRGLAALRTEVDQETR